MKKYNTYKATINVYFSKQVNIEIKAKSEEDAREEISNWDHRDKIDDRLEGDDFELSTEFCDEFTIDNIEEVV